MEWADLLALLLLILPLVGMKPVCGTNRMNEEYLSLNTGKSLRGLFAIAIVLHHLSQESTSAGGYLFRHFAYTGYLYVAFFFFLSGYGLQKSYITSENYKKGFLQKRLSKILLPYAIVALLYWIKNTIMHNTYSVKDTFIGFITGSLVTFSWYIICICCFYVAFWAIMHICKKNYPLMIFCACLWFVAYMFICKHLAYGQWWYNTPHLLVLGMVWACYEAKILRIITKHYFAAIFITPVVFSVMFIAKTLTSTESTSLLLSMLTALLFVFFVILLSLKAKVNNRILAFLGDISLEIYLIHGLWIAGTGSRILQINDDFLRALVVLSGGIASAAIMHKCIVKFFKWMDMPK